MRQPGMLQSTAPGALDVVAPISHVALHGSWLFARVSRSLIFVPLPTHPRDLTTHISGALIADATDAVSVVSEGGE
jgi:hypothetical protein